MSKLLCSVLHSMRFSEQFVLLSSLHCAWMTCIQLPALITLKAGCKPTTSCNTAAAKVDRLYAEGVGLMLPQHCCVDLHQSCNAQAALRCMFMYPYQLPR